MLAAGAADTDQIGRLHPEVGGVVRVQVEIGFGQVGGQARRQRGAGHRVPLVADPAGVEAERVARAGPGGGRAVGHGDHPRLAVGMEELAIREEPPPLPVLGHGPAAGAQGGIAAIVQVGPERDVEILAEPPGNAGQRGVFAEDLGRSFVIEGRVPAHAAPDLGQLLPVGARLAGDRQNRALAADRAVGIGDGAVLFAPGGGGQQHVGQTRGVGLVGDVGDDGKFAAGNGVAHPVGIGHRHGGVGVDDPQRLDLPLAHGAEHVDRLEARRLGHGRRLPELAHRPAMFGIFQVEVTGQHVGQPADLAPAHGIGLAGHAEGPHAGATDAACGEVAIEDRVDLVGPGGGLVHPLAEDRHDLFVAHPEIAEGLDLGRVQTGRRHIVGIGRAQRVVEAVHPGQEPLVQRAPFVKPHQQPVEQRHVTAGLHGQVHLGGVATGGPARVDDDDAGAAGLLRGQDALVEHRVTPGEVGTDQDDHVGLFEVLIGAGHGVGAEGAAMASHGGRHAEPRIRVDIRRTDEALHQLVCDVVILGQQLAGDVEGDAVGPVIGDGLAEPFGDERQGAVPAGLLSTDAGGQQAVVQPDGFGQRRSLGTEPPAIGRVIRVALHIQPAMAIGAQEHTAPHPAIGAGGAGRGHPGPVHHAACLLVRAVPSIRMRPFSTRTG